MDQWFDKYDEHMTYRHCCCCSFHIHSSHDDRNVAAVLLEEEAAYNANGVDNIDGVTQRRDKENDGVDKSHLHRLQSQIVDNRFLDY